MAEGKPVKWHRMGFSNFVKHEANRPMFRPFLIGAAATWFICGVLPTMGADDESKEQSNFWKRTHGKFDYLHH